MYILQRFKTVSHALKSKISEIRKYLGHRIRTVVSDITIRTRFGKNRSGSGAIKVAFIVQMPEVWDKEAPLFEAMAVDRRFDPKLIVVPSYNMVSRTFNEYGTELVFFLSKYKDNYVIRAFDNDWFDIKEKGFEYVFYQRCYEEYLPERYHTKNVIKYAKTAYIPYAYHALPDPRDYYRTSFFDYLYMFFCFSDAQRDFQERTKSRVVRSVGYPAFEIIREFSLEKNNDSKRILWTPRWIDEPASGGSTFIKYLYRVSELKQLDPSIDLWLRPHPLAFQNAVKDGILSENDVEAFKTKMNELGVVIDHNEYVEKSLADTDILVTDLSSIIIFYFMFGRPIVYCADPDLDYVPEFRTIIDCSYIAHDWNEVESYIKMLVAGEDPLKEKRELAASALRDSQTGASKKMLECIVEDSGYRE